MNLTTATTRRHGLQSTWLRPDNNDPVPALWFIIAVAFTSYASARALRSGHAWVHCLINIFIICRSPVKSLWPEYLQWLLPLAIVGVCIALCIAIYATLQLQQPPATISASENPRQILRPLLLPCRTTHRRFFPAKHSFNYSYLFVGIPVHWRGNAAGILSTPPSPHDSDRNANAWFSVHPEDYLARGSHPSGLQGKLTDYLTSQEVDPALYPTAYLVTAPRFLGFSFNPVSFWYLYNHAGALAAMILEVNNTFDERRMYFLPRDTDTDTNTNTSETRFSHNWPKDFHVSPFNDRQGTYSLLTKDVRLGALVDNTITLLSPDNKPKLVARIFSTTRPITPETMTRLQKFGFVLRWCMIGFLTNPRILREAWTLWWKDLRVFCRPEPLASSIGRTPSNEEIQLERSFRVILRTLADEHGLSVVYEAAAGPGCGRGVVVGGKGSGDGSERIRIKVLTPAFYSELARSVRAGKSLVDVLVYWSSGVEEHARMLVIDSSEVLGRLFRNVGYAPGDRADDGKKVLGRALGRRALSWVLSGVLGPVKSDQSRSDRAPTFLDLVRQYSVDGELQEVLWSSARICLADRIALGMTGLLTMYTSVLRCLCVGLLTRYLARWAINI